jgi:hypothetical protein
MAIVPAEAWEEIESGVIEYIISSKLYPRSTLFAKSTLHIRSEPSIERLTSLKVYYGFIFFTENVYGSRLKQNYQKAREVFFKLIDSDQWYGNISITLVHIFFPNRDVDLRSISRDTPRQATGCLISSAVSGYVNYPYIPKHFISLGPKAISWSS